MLRLTFLLFAPVLHSAAASTLEESIVSRIVGLAKPTTHEVTYYRWASKQLADNLTQAGIFSGSIFKQYLDHPQRMTMGAGLYLAPTPWSFSDYFFKDSQIWGHDVREAINSNNAGKIAKYAKLPLTGSTQFPRTGAT